MEGVLIDGGAQCRRQVAVLNKELRKPPKDLIH